MTAHVTLLGAGCDTTTALLLGGYLAILVALGVDYWRQQFRAWRSEDEPPDALTALMYGGTRIAHVIGDARPLVQTGEIRGGAVVYRADDHHTPAKRALLDMGRMLDAT